MILHKPTKRPIAVDLEDGIVRVPLGASAAGWHAIKEIAAGCPKADQYSRVRGIRLDGPYMPEPLSIGLLIHQARAQWYYDLCKGDNWRRAMLDYKSRSEAIGQDLWPGSIPISVNYFEQYVEHWKLRARPEVLAVEHPLDPRRLYPDAPEWLVRTARLDSVERWRGKLWIGECKTTSDSPRKVHDVYMLNGQTLMGLTLWGKDEREQFGELAGVLLDVLVKRAKTCKFERVALPKEQMSHALTWFKKDFPIWVMQQSMIKWNDHVERKMICLRTPEGPCRFRPLCLRGFKGSNRFVYGKNGRRLSQWKPSPGKEVPPWD